MIPAEVLRAVCKIVVHANCPDGKASAVILHAALPDAEIVEVAYDSTAHVDMRAEPGMLFCDFAPHRTRIAEFVEAGAIVLDHHKGAENIVRAFGERGVFADEKGEPGVSGAVLALREVFGPLFPDVVARDHQAGATWSGVDRLAYLIGIRDTWQRSSPDWQRACEVSAAVRFLPLDDALRRGPAGVMRFADEVGAPLVRKQLEAAKEAAETAVRMTADGRRVAVIPSVSLTSDVADALRDDVDIVAGFDYVHDARGVRLQWSLRSRGDVDVSAIARRHGGNGHTAAAGFYVALPAINPYQCVAGLLSVA